MGLTLKARAKTFINNNETLWKIKRGLYSKLYDYRDWRRGVPNWVTCPQDIQIDTNNYCSSTHEPDEQGNLIHKYAGCVFCNVKAGGSFNIPRGRMEDDLLFYIIDYWGKYKHRGVENICPYVNGDLIIDDRALEIYDASEKAGLNVVLDTSGNVYKNRDYLIHPNLKYIRFSLSAITPETYEKVQGCPKFDEVMKTFHYVAENKHPTQTIELHFMVNKYNEHEIDDYIKYFKGYKIKIFPLHKMPDIQLNSTASLPSEKWRNVSGTLKEWMNSRPIFIYPNGYRERQVMRANRTCQGMSMAVNWDGKILHCTDAPPKYNYGYVKADGSGVDMLEAWHQRNRNRITNPACIACNAKRPDWYKVLQRYDLATPEEIEALLMYQTALNMRRKR